LVCLARCNICGQTGGTYQFHLGARYVEQLSQNASLLLCNHGYERKEKLQYAFDRGIPVVRFEWLKDSIEAGEKKDITSYTLLPSQSGHRSSSSLARSLSIKPAASSNQSQPLNERSASQDNVSKGKTVSKVHKSLKKSMDRTAQNENQIVQAKTLGLRKSEFAPINSVYEEETGSLHQLPRDCEAGDGFISRSEAHHHSHSQDETSANTTMRPTHETSQPPTSHLTDTIASLLAQKQAMNATSTAETETGGLRKRRGALGRAPSNPSTEPTRPQTIDGGADEYSQEEHLLKPKDPPLPSQQLTYDDPETNKYREVMLKRIGSNATTGEQQQLLKKQEVVKDATSGIETRSRPNKRRVKGF
jgi:hypothetical protein